METKVDQEMKLHFIDKAYNGMVESNQIQNRLLVLLIISSFIVASLSLGLISITQEFSIGGFNLTISLGLILASGSFLICFLFAYYIILLNRGRNLSKTIYRLYKEIGYEDKSMHSQYGKPVIPFDYHSFTFTTSKRKKKIDQIFNNLSIIVNALLTILLIPIIVPILAIYRLIVTFHWSWIILTVVVLDIIMLAIGFWHLTAPDEEL